MKRLFSLLLAGCMLASVTAFAADNNSITGGTATVTGSTDVAKPSVGDTLVEYTTANESYTITIPTKITIDTTNKVSAATDTVTLSEVFLANGATLDVTATALNSTSNAKNDNGFELFLVTTPAVEQTPATLSSTVKVPYTLESKTTGDFASVANEGSILADVGTQQNLGSQQNSDKAIATLKASIAAETDIPATGTYQANVRFTVSYTAA